MLRYLSTGYASRRIEALAPPFDPRKRALPLRYRRIRANGVVACVRFIGLNAIRYHPAAFDRSSASSLTTAHSKRRAAAT